MNREMLGRYFWLNHEIQRQETRKRRLQKKIDSGGIVTDIVTGSSAHFPYIETKFKITGVPTGMLESIENGIKANIKEAAEARYMIACFIDGVEDPQLRELLRSRFIDCLSWKEVGRQNYINPDHARKKTREFLKTLK